RRFLNRLPDAVGFSSWVSSLLQGLYTDEQVEAFFIGSVEYIQDHGGHGAAWITGMYEDLLGRHPAEAEVQSWLSGLNAGTRLTAIALGFAASPEREAGRVRFNYQTYLGRSARQDEIDLWVNGFLQGLTNEDMVAGFIESPEYYGNPEKGQGNKAHW